MPAAARPTEIPARIPSTTQERQRRRRSARAHSHEALIAASPQLPPPQRTTSRVVSAGRLLSHVEGAGPPLAGWPTIMGTASRTPTPMSRAFLPTYFDHLCPLICDKGQ